MSARAVLVLAVSSCTAGTTGPPGFLIAWNGADGSPSLSDFVKKDQFSEIELSPDGEHLAVTMPTGNRTILTILRRDTLEPTAAFQTREYEHVHHVHWVSTRRLVFKHALKYGWDDYPVSLPHLAAMDIDGGRSRRLEFPGHAWIVDPEPDQPRRVVVRVDSWRHGKQEIYIVDDLVDASGRNAFKKARQRAPVQSASLLVDQYGFARFALSRDKRAHVMLWERTRQHREWKRLPDWEGDFEEIVPLRIAADDRTAFILAVEKAKTSGLYRKLFWIEGILTELGAEVDIVGWDPYSRYWLEELPLYADDIQQVQQIITASPSNAEIGFSEFGIHGGPPTFDNEYSSRYTQLYLLGTMAQALNAGATYPLYFMLYDNGWNTKGLVSSGPYPPVTSNPLFFKKPQYYAMQIVQEITDGELIDTQADRGQLDALASVEGSTHRIALSNRYEAATTANANLAGSFTATVSRLEDDGLVELQSGVAAVDRLTIQMEPWTAYYVTLQSQ